MYIQKIAIIFDHSRLGLENEFFLKKKNNPVAQGYSVLPIYLAR